MIRLIPKEQWLPCEPTIRSCPGHRDPSLYWNCAGQFDVLNHPRYTPTADKTWCNIYVSDVLEAMGVRPGHYWLGVELSADAMHDWFINTGPKYNWHELSPDRAREEGWLGCPTVAAWNNPKVGNSGHIVIVLPDQKGIRIAQAGRTNLFNASLTQGFGASISPRFFSHP